MVTIRMRRAHDNNMDWVYSRGRTLENAILNAGKTAGQIKRNSYREIGNLQQIDNGSTYHVQFGYPCSTGGEILGDTFVVQKENKIKCLNKQNGS